MCAHPERGVLRHVAIGGELLRQALEEEGSEQRRDVFDESTEDEQEDDTTPTQSPVKRRSEARENQPLLQQRLSGVHDDSIFQIEPSLASPFGGPTNGTDCSSLEGIEDVSCISGSCVVHACRPGYAISAEGDSCARGSGRNSVHEATEGGLW